MIAQQVKHPRIVLVEDDEALQRHVAVALRRSFSDLDISGTKDAAEALHWAEDERCCLLITDAQTRQLDGIAIATNARKRRPTLPVIVMSNPPCNVDDVTSLVDVAWLEKPPRIDRLVVLVERMLSLPVGFTGKLTVDGLPDLVQLLHMMHATGALEVEHKSEHGRIWFERGAIVDSSLGELQGKASFHQILRWEGGRFSMDRQGRANQRTIQLPTMQLLLESMCQLDQDRAGGTVVRPQAAALKSSHANRTIHRSSSPSHIRLKTVDGEQRPEPPPPAGYTVASFTPQQQAAERFQRGLELAQAKQYSEAMAEWEAACQLDPEQRVYQVNLKRLREVQLRSQPPRGTDGDQE
jgi:CheY-like chemotaxis protein